MNFTPIQFSFLLTISIIIVVTVILTAEKWLETQASRRKHTKAVNSSVTVEKPARPMTKVRHSVHIKRLDGSEYVYQRVEKYFREQWTKETANYPVPPIPVVIYAIKNDDLTSRYHQYKEKMFNGSSESNEEWHFHGTSIKCDIINRDKCCNDKTCGVCGISRNGFDLSFIRNRFSDLAEESTLHLILRRVMTTQQVTKILTTKHSFSVLWHVVIST